MMGSGIRRTIGLVGVLAVGMGCACAQGAAPPAGEAKTTVVMPPTPLLATSDSLVASSPEYPVPDDGAEVRAILKEDGLTRSEACVTLVAAGSKKVASGWVKAYQFGDATGAMSAYTYFAMGGKTAGASKVNATDTVTPGGERVYLSGTSVVRAQVKQYPESVDGLLKKIDFGLPKVGGRRGLAPLLPGLLPVDVAGTKIDPASLRYALGPAGYQAMGGVLPAEILGWDKSAEVVTANYSGKGGKGTLTLLLYPTPQIAGDRGRAVEAAVNAKPGALGTVKMRRVGPLVGVTAGGLSADAAEGLIHALKLNQEVSFDKPMPLEFHAEVRKTATLLQEIAVFVGLMILAAVVLAVFLGGIRAGWRVMHGKSAASDPEFLTIDLRGEPHGFFAPKDPGPDKPAS